MSYTRISIDLAFKNPMSNTVKNKLQELKTLAKQGKTYAKKINEGQPNEENTVRATYHVCYHDEPGNNAPCTDIEI